MLTPTRRRVPWPTRRRQPLRWPFNTDPTSRGGTLSGTLSVSDNGRPDTLGPKISRNEIQGRAGDVSDHFLNRCMV